MALPRIRGHPGASRHQHPGARRGAPAAANLLAGRVHGLVLSATGAGLQSRSEQERQKFVRERVEPITQGQTIGQYAPTLLRTMMGPSASGPLVDKVVCQTPSSMSASMNALIERDNRPTLRDVAVPTLLIAGENDTACPPAGMTSIAELVPGSEFAQVPEAGHYLFAESPEHYHTLVGDFLTRRVLHP